jgi:lambda family phage portal protein
VNLFNIFKRNTPAGNAPSQSTTRILTGVPGEISASIIPSQARHEYHDGSKFLGGFGDTKIFTTDYWTLRRRSAQLFKENLYARGIIRRLVTNEINTGLSPEVLPNEMVLGLEDDSLAEWSEDVEDRFSIWAENPDLCDTTRQSTFGKIQAIVRSEALVSGDVLIVLRIDRNTGLPRVQVISGDSVQTPMNAKPLADRRIEHGVEINKFNQHTAYYVNQEDGTSIRIAARGAKTGRKVAWLMYGTDRRAGEVRGEPLLSLILQSLKEVDRYRDATQRKAAVNAMLAMFIKKTQEKMGTRPITGGAVRKKSGEITDGSGEPRQYNMASLIPGLVIEELQVGEEPVAFGNQGTDTNFGDFESAMIQAVAWALEIPPEVLQLSFSSNYSASQAAINEFKIYLNRVRADFGASFCKPIYNEWLLGQSLTGKISALGLFEAWTDKSQYDILGAWLTTDWSGAIKPSTDMRKQAQGYQLMVESGFITNARAAKELTGTKFRRNIRILNRENAAKVEAGLVLPAPANIASDPADDEDEGK